MNIALPGQRLAAGSLPGSDSDSRPGEARAESFRAGPIAAVTGESADARRRTPSRRTARYP
eukprot:43329-Hanusia_phi.AAC.1